MHFLNAQSKRVLKWEAAKAINNKDWSIAVQYYNLLYRKDTTDNNIKFQYAELCRLNYEIDLAMNLYLSLSNSDQGQKFPLSFYWLAQLAKNKERYKEAKAWFTKFTLLKYTGERSEYYNSKANLEIASCDWAMEELKKKKKNAVEHISPSINSKSNEFAAIEKDSVLYFS